MVNARISIKDVQIAFGGTIVGGSEEVSVSLAAENTVAHEGGSYNPAEIVDGKRTISGSMTRAYIDHELLNELFPNVRDSPLLPDFTMTGTIVSGKKPDRPVTLTGVKFKSVDINGFGLSDYAKNSLEFDALNWTFA